MCCLAVLAHWTAHCGCATACCPLAVLALHTSVVGNSCGSLCLLGARGLDATPHSPTPLHGFAPLEPLANPLPSQDFLGRLKGYDKDTIPPRVIAAIRSGYLTNEFFTPDNAKKASPAAEGMCKWVHAMSSYDKVAKVGTLLCGVCTALKSGCLLFCSSGPANKCLELLSVEVLADLQACRACTIYCTLDKCIDPA